MKKPILTLACLFFLVGSCFAGDSGSYSFSNLTVTSGTIQPSSGVLDLAAYGATCDGVTDTSAAFANAISKAVSMGGGTINLLPGKVCAVANTITISNSDIGFSCPDSGPDAPHSSGVAVPTTACWIKWTGSAGGTIMSFIAPSGSTTDGVLTGNFVKGVGFDGNSGAAANAIILESVWYGDFTGNFFKNFNGGYVIDVNVVHSTGSNFGDNCDSQFNRFVNNSILQYNGTSVGIRLGTWNDNSIPNHGCNASLNTFVDTDIENSTGEGILFDGADNNTFIRTRVFTSGGTPDSVDFGINTSNSLTFPANSNTLIDLSANEPIIARGTVSNPSCTTAFVIAPGVGACTFGNTILGLDKGNSTPDPTVENDAQVIFHDTNGVENGAIFTKAAFGDNDTSALGAESGLLSGTETVVIRNGSNNQLILDDNAATNSWGINIAPDSNLRFEHILGAGNGIDLPGQLYTVGTLPTVGSCGTGAVVTAGSTDSAGQIETGTGTVNSCVITFASLWGSQPFCTATSVGSPVTVGVNISTTTVTLEFPASEPSTFWEYHCIQ